MKWVIYYSDGSTISNEDTTPYAVERRTGVQVVVQTDDEIKWEMLCGTDYYVWDSRGGRPKWFKASESGLHQYLMQPGFKCVLLGYEIDRKAYNEIYNRAREEFGEKAGFTRAEAEYRD